MKDENGKRKLTTASDRPYYNYESTKKKMRLYTDRLVISSGLVSNWERGVAKGLGIDISQHT